MEIATTHIKCAMTSLLDMLTLASMYRATENKEFAKMALRHVKSIEEQVALAKYDLEKHV